MSVWEEWSNTTYYNDEDMQYLVTRVVDSMNGLASPPHSSANWTGARTFQEVQVRIYGGALVGGKGQLKSLYKEGKPQRMRLCLGIHRRGRLFGSDLEAIAGLAGDAPMVPEKGVALIAASLVKAIASGGCGNALRQEYRDRHLGVAHTSYGWPHEVVTLFVKEVILPSCQIRIDPRSKKGASHEQSLIAAKSGLAQKEWAVEWWRNDRIRAQDALEEAVRRETQAEVAVARARARLFALENKTKRS
jgi:hypothetical protein